MNQKKLLKQSSLKRYRSNPRINSGVIYTSATLKTVSTVYPAYTELTLIIRFIRYLRVLGALYGEFRSMNG